MGMHKLKWKGVEIVGCDGRLHIQERQSEATREKQAVQEERKLRRKRQEKRRMRITKTSNVWIFALAAHGIVATSYFVHVLT